MLHCMRQVLALVLLVSLLWGNSMAQVGNWAAVEGLAPGDDISVKTIHRKYQGHFDSADPERLIVWSQERDFPGRMLVKREIPRSEVTQVRFNHRFASTVAGAAIGTGIGLGLGAAIDASARSNEDNGVASVVFGMLGGALGAILGKTHPFIKGTVIYQAP